MFREIADRKIFFLI